MFSSNAKLDKPVTLPPGRARLPTSPLPTGSPTAVITMGMVLLAPFAANASGAPVTTIRSTLRRTRSAASSSGERSFFCSANRYSMVMFFPSIHPSLLSSCRNTSARTALPEAVLVSRNPMRRIFTACWALADEQSEKSIAHRVRTVIFFFMSLSLSRSTRYSTLDTRPFSLDHLIRPREHFRRNGQADLLRCFQVDHKLKLRCLLHRQISRFGTFQDLVHVN